MWNLFTCYLIRYSFCSFVHPNIFHLIKKQLAYKRYNKKKTFLLCLHNNLTHLCCFVTLKSFTNLLKYLKDVLQKNISENFSIPSMHHTSPDFWFKKKNHDMLNEILNDGCRGRWHIHDRFQDNVQLKEILYIGKPLLNF